MFFYFPCISSDIERREQKEKVDKKIEDLYDDLRWLIRWEDTFNSEIRGFGGEAKVSDYTYLKNVIDKILNK